MLTVGILLGSDEGISDGSSLQHLSPSRPDADAIEDEDIDPLQTTLLVSTVYPEQGYGDEPSSYLEVATIR